MQRVVLITGASSGFGAATARRFARSGDMLILAARNTERLQQLATEIDTVPVHVAAVDVTQADAVNQLMDELPLRFRRVDVLINNAGLALGLEPAHQANMDDWETMVDTNIKGLLRVTRAVLPGMVERNCGHIVNIGSTAGNWPYPGGNTYGASKAFVQQFSRNLRADLIGKMVRVTNIEPGMADTNFSAVRFKGDHEKAARVYEGTQPLTADDVADIIHWVCSVPPHVNVNTLEVMPTCQAWGPLAVDRSMTGGSQIGSN